MFSRRMLHELVKGVRQLSRAVGQVKADRINFSSGLGDSASLLYGLTRSMKPNVCVEIGSARGRSTCFIGMALKDNGGGKLYAIDPHARTPWNDSQSIETFDVLTRNLKSLGLTQHVDIIRKNSTDAAKEWHRQIDFIFIDGDHSYEGVKRDWNLFVPHVGEFGLVVFHDTMWDLQPDNNWSRADMGVPRFVEELRLQGYPLVTIARDWGISIVQPSKGGRSLLRQHAAPTNRVNTAEN